jgi:LPXTG-motif cell wall-anchored protein
MLLLVAPLGVGQAGAQPLEYPGPLNTTNGTGSETPPADTVSSVTDAFAPVSAQPGSSVAATDTTTVGGTGGGNSGLAVTGSEAEPIAAIGLGLLAVGGSALVSSRRRLFSGDN